MLKCIDSYHIVHMFQNKLGTGLSKLDKHEEKVGPTILAQTCCVSVFFLFCWNEYKQSCFLHTFLISNVYFMQNVDLVVEAVFESLQVKETVFRQLDAACKPSAILASNTSSFDIDRLASFTSRPQKVS